MQDILPIHFAPLQGYTEAFYRNAHAACFGGIDSYYTPFVRLEKDGFRNKDVREIAPESNQVPHLVPQLIAPSIEKAETILSLFIEKGYKEADINLGCPFPLLAKRHNGSGILPYPDEVKTLLGLTLKYPQISFSVKMRLGWENPDECLQLAPILNDLPLRHITMHPRLGKQQYKGSVDLNGFDAFLNVCQHPLIYNGDINRPALALEYKENRTLTPDEMKEKLHIMHTSVYNQYAAQLEGGDGQLLNKMKTFWEYLAPNADRKLMKAIHKSTSLSKYNQAIQAFFSQR